ncbi:N-acyl homoserine lactonase family protein [Bradyrhizobium sp. dw_411]|uniref:N-acyl homoserine lactonase family protein n=1 Tax=Bradyrhizobium sp. dw_411 TaxID=2720082 RepID=UPI001BCC2878|nr:N-acyl homoserine lactonase family protein [Bradyrhizobium sp. dw_411]
MENANCVERIYILDGGLAKVDDGSIYSPGINVGVPMTLSCNAYLIRHPEGWLLWDTGTADEMTKQPEGRVVAHGIRGVVRTTIASQLESIGVAPDEIDRLVLSHAHYDHVGNCRLFPKARWIAQKAERDAMFGPNPEEFGYVRELYETLGGNPTEIVEGDHDIFGDGSVRLIFTPGHTLGHCSLLVRLPETGPIILSGDVAHNRENFRLRRIPTFNADHAATVASMDRVDALVRELDAGFWINHDTEQNGTLAHAPRWVV